MSPTQVLDRRRFPELVAVVLVFLALLVWGGVLELALLGWDTYPLIATSRVDSLAELPALLNTELMDGRYPLGHYWRPLVHLSFALDHALFGLAPVGYHSTDLFLFVAVALAIASLARRLGLGNLGAAIAGSVWVLHPAQIDVLTVPARRAETMAILFTTLAVVAVLGRREQNNEKRKPWSLVIAGLFCAAALASKESGAIALPLVLAVLLLPMQRGAQPPAPSAVLRSATIPTVCFILALAWRTSVLSGLGGSVESGPTPFLDALRSLPANLAHYGALVVVPGSIDHAWVGALFLVLLALGSGRRIGSPGALKLLALWLLLAAALAGVSGLQRDWYALPLLVPFALGLARALRGALLAIRKGKPTSPKAWAQVLAGVVLATSWGFQIHGAVRAPHAPAYGAASDAVQGLLTSFSTRLETQAPGTNLRVEAAFEWDLVDDDGLVLRRIHPVAPYGLLAYAELVHPERELELHVHTAPPEEPASSGAVRVLVVPRAYQVPLAP